MKAMEDWTTPEINAVVAALVRWESELMASSPFACDDSFEAIWYHTFGGGSFAVLVDGYLVLYDIGTTPYSFKPVLFEYLIIQVTQGGDVRNAISGLIDLAKQNECYAVCSGNSSGRSGLTRLYQRAGFRKVNEAMMKVI